MTRFAMAEFPLDFETKYKEFICKDEPVTSECFDDIYGDDGFKEFCNKVKGKTLMVKMDGIDDCFEVEDNNWCIPLCILTAVEIEDSLGEF